MLKNLKKTVAQNKLGVIATTAVLSSVSAMADDTAQMDLSNVSFNTADAIAVGTLVLGAVAVIWGIKKAISFGNRG